MGEQRRGEPSGSRMAARNHNTRNNTEKNIGNRKSAASGRTYPGRPPVQTERQRKKKRRNSRTGLAVLVFLLCLFSFFLGRCSASCSGAQTPEENGGDSADPAAGGAADETAAAGNEEDPVLAEMAEKTALLKKRNYVREHPDQYPADLRQLMEDQPEALEFVYDYAGYTGQKEAVDLSDEVTKGEIPYFIQWDERWGYEFYGEERIALGGCGPTCLSMVYSGLTGKTDMDPLAMAAFSEKNGFYMENVGTSWELMSTGAEKLGLSVSDPGMTLEGLAKCLYNGQPVICSMSPGDFTSQGHFIVLWMKNGREFCVYDPNSPERTAKQWTIEEVYLQVKHAWAYSIVG